MGLTGALNAVQKACQLTSVERRIIKCLPSWNIWLKLQQLTWPVWTDSWRVMHDAWHMYCTSSFIYRSSFHEWNEQFCIHENFCPGMHHVHMKPVWYYDNIVYWDTIFFACYRDNSHRNNVLKVRPKCKIQVHVIMVLHLNLPMWLACCNEAVNKKALTLS